MVGGSEVSFTVAATGTLPLSYQWQFDGIDLPQRIITTVAGNGTTGDPGDGGLATNAILGNPSDVTVDKLGNLFIADEGYEQIRKVSADGVITTVAGRGDTSFDGDGGPATSAGLSAPSGVAVDALGNLFIADGGNQRIRKVDTNGVITTVAGNGIPGYSGDGGPAVKASLFAPTAVALDALGDLFVVCAGRPAIRKIDTHGIITTVAGNGNSGYSGDGGAATNAMLSTPGGLAVDASGNLYIADGINQRIRRVDASGVIKTVAGNGVEGYSGDGGFATNASLFFPAGIAVDASGMLYIADGNNQRVRRVDTNGVITTVAGNGSKGFSGDGEVSTNASLDFPGGVAVDGAGDLLIADYDNQRIRKVWLNGDPALGLDHISGTNAGGYRVVVSNPQGSVTSVVATLAIAVPPFITRQPATVVTNPGASISLTVAAGGAEPLSYQWFLNGKALAGAAGPALTLRNIGAANAGIYTVVVGNIAGTVTSSNAVLVLTVPPTIEIPPQSLTVTNGAEAGFSVAVSGTAPIGFQWLFNGVDLPREVVSTVAGNGGSGFGGDGGVASHASFANPAGVAIDASGNVYVADQGNSRIRKVGTNGVVTTVAGNGNPGYSGDGGPATNASLNQPAGVALDARGNLFIEDYENHCVRKVDLLGIITTVAGNGLPGNSGDGGPATNASLWFPDGVVVDGAGNIFISDQLNDCVRKVGTNGIITTVAGNGRFGYSGDGGAATGAALGAPAALAVDASGHLFIADTDNQCVRRVDAKGVIATVAGTGTRGFSGDGGPATNAALNDPAGVAVDVFGNLFIADTDNQRIRWVDTNGIITTLAGRGSPGYSGDGGAAAGASFNSPSGVATDASGHLFVADESNNRVREVWLNGDPALMVDNVSSSNAGAYQVVVSGPFGSVTSPVATLTVLSPPVITTHPASITTNQGANLYFTVAADGTAPLAYQWLLNGKLLAGATNALLTLTNVQPASEGGYSAVVANIAGTVTSMVAQLTVTPPVGPILVSLLSPTNGANFIAGTNVLCRASASEANGTVTNVAFYLNATNLLGLAATSPYTFLWSQIPAGSNLFLTAVAFDASGVSATSAPVSLVVTNPLTPPVQLAISLLSPADGSVICNGNDVFIQASVSTTQALASVQFYAGGSLLGSVPGQSGPSSYSFDWVQGSGVPLAAGHYLMTAVANDTLRHSATSAPVGVTVTTQCAQSAIVRAAADPEIEALQSFLAEMGLSSQVFDQAGLSVSALQGYPLVIWDDVGRTNNAPTSNTVEVLNTIQAGGAALYLIGEHLAASAGSLPPAVQSVWQGLTHLGVSTGVGGNGVVQMINAEGINNPILDGPYGSIGSLTNADAVDLATVVQAPQATSEVLATESGADLLAASPPLTAAGSSPARIFTQNIRTLPPGDGSVATNNLRILFQNVVCWLTGCENCTGPPSLELAGAESSPVMLVGQTNHYTLTASCVGGCEARGLYLVDNLPSGSAFLSASPAQLLQFYDPIGNVVSFNIGARVPVGGSVSLVIDVLATRPGVLTNTAFVQPYSGTSVVKISAPLTALVLAATNPPPPALSLVTLPNKALQLKLAGQGGVLYEVDSSTDLLNWLLYTNVAGPGWSQILPPPNTTPGRLFFRAGNPH